MKPYNREEFINAIADTYAEIMTADDAGTVDFAAARLQEYFHEMEWILDENGGI